MHMPQSPEGAAARSPLAAEVASLAAERCFHALKAPIKRVTRADVVVPYSAPIEAEVLATVERLEAAVRTVMV